MFQAPALVLSLLLSSVYAVAFLLWQGRRFRELPAFLLASLAGFAAGQLAGEEVAVVPWMVGQVRIVEATVGSWLVLFVLAWLKRSGKTP